MTRSDPNGDGLVSTAPRTPMNALFRRSSLLPLVGCLVLASACNDDGLLLPDAGATPVDGLAPDGAGPAPDAGTPLDGAPPSDGPPPEAGALYGDQPFSIVLLPDTQFYALAYPEMFRAEAAWIVAQKEA